MAQVIVTLRVMPTNIKINLSNIEKEVIKKIDSFGGKIGKVNQEPIAFGLIALIISFFSDESKSNLDPLEESIKNIKDVESVNIIEVRRAVG